MKINNIKPIRERFRPVEGNLLLTAFRYYGNINRYDISSFSNSISPVIPVEAKYMGLMKSYTISDGKIVSGRNFSPFKGSNYKSYTKTVFPDVFLSTFMTDDDNYPTETYPISGVIDSIQYNNAYTSVDYYAKNFITDANGSMIPNNYSAESIRELFLTYYNGVNDTNYIRPFLSEFQFVNSDKLKQGDPDINITDYNTIMSNDYLKQTFRVPFFIKVSNIKSDMDEIQIAFNVRGVPIFYRKLRVAPTSLLFIYPEYLVGIKPYSDNNSKSSNIPIDVVDSHAYDYSGTIDNIWYKTPKIKGNTVTVEVAARISVNENNIPCFTSTGLYSSESESEFIGGIDSTLEYELEKYNSDGDFTGFETVNFQPIKKLSYTNEINTLNRIA